MVGGRAQCFLGYSEAIQENVEEARSLYESAIEDFNEAIKLDPKNAATYYQWLGFVNSALGKLKQR